MTGTRPPILCRFEEGVPSPSDFFRQLDWIMLGTQFAQDLGVLFRELLMLQETLAGRQSRAIDFADLGVDALFAQKLEARNEQISEQLVGLVESPHGFFQRGTIEPIVAQLLSDVGGIFLLDVGIVVLLAGAGASKLDRLGRLADPTQQMVIDELVAIVGVNASEREWHALSHGLERL